MQHALPGSHHARQSGSHGDAPSVMNHHSAADLSCKDGSERAIVLNADAVVPGTADTSARGDGAVAVMAAGSPSETCTTPAPADADMLMEQTAAAGAQHVSSGSHSAAYVTHDVSATHAQWQSTRPSSEQAVAPAEQPPVRAGLRPGGGRCIDASAPLQLAARSSELGAQQQTGKIDIEKHSAWHDALATDAASTPAGKPVPDASGKHRACSASNTTAATPRRLPAAARASMRKLGLAAHKLAAGQKDAGVGIQAALHGLSTAGSASAISCKKSRPMCHLGVKMHV